MYKSPSLDHIRQKIDTLDNTIHDLLMERADLVMAISEAKKREGVQIVQPAREARMLRRLIARHKGPLPEETIVRIWRELVSSVSLLQTGLSVAVYVPSNLPEYWDMARDYFGSVLPMVRVDSISSVLDMVLENRVTFGVLPFPDGGASAPWLAPMVGAIERGETVAVIQRLPFGEKEHYDYERHPALVVSRSSFGESGDDRSLCLLKSGGVLSPEMVVDALAGAGLDGAFLLSEGVDAIIAIHRYVAPGDTALVSLGQDLSARAGRDIRVVHLGGYPTPLVYS